MPWLVTHSLNAVGSMSQSMTRRNSRSAIGAVPVFLTVTTSSYSEAFSADGRYTCVTRSARSGIDWSLTSTTTVACLPSGERVSETGVMFAVPADSLAKPARPLATSPTPQPSHGQPGAVESRLSGT